MFCMSEKSNSSKDNDIKNIDVKDIKDVDIEDKKIETKKTIVKKKRKFQVFVWNSKIHNAFLALLVLCVFMLFSAMLLQNVYIEHLENKVVYKEYMGEAFEFERDVMLMDDFLEKTGLEAANVADMVVYFNKNNFEDVYYNKGYVEATLDQCLGDVCKRVTYKFNQNKGLYIDVIQRNID